MRRATSVQQPPSSAPPRSSYAPDPSLLNRSSTHSGSTAYLVPNSSRLRAPGPGSSSAWGRLTEEGPEDRGRTPPPPYNPFDTSAAERSDARQRRDAPARPTVGAKVERGTGSGRRSEDMLSSLKRYHIVLLVDDSDSMVELWDEARSALMGLVERCVQYDREGVDLYFLNDLSPPSLNLVTASQVRNVFDRVSPRDSTPTGFVLDNILRPYVEGVENYMVSSRQSRPSSYSAPVKPTIVLVLTDGRADDADLVKDILIEMAQRLDDVRAPPFQLGVQFVQIGQDEEASEFLQELDDDLKEQTGVRDIVDTVPYSGVVTPDFLVKTLLGSVVKRLDNMT